MIRFGQTCAAIAAKAGKLEKIAILAAYLQGLSDADLAPAARFFTGNPFPARDERTLGIGPRTIVAAAQSAWGVEDVQLARAYREHGDLGAALGPFVRPPMRLALFAERLAPALLYELFEAIAAANGASAGKKRQALCERILSACEDAVEATYVVKIMTGDLRIGLREGLIVEAISSAFGAAEREVRRGVMVAGDVGAVALAARHNRLGQLRIAYGSPVGFMLATPLAYGSDYRELREGVWIAEEKYDGIRAQLHKSGERVRIFSRTLNEVTRTYPEIARAAEALEGDFMLDGEIVAMRAGAVLPFRYLQARLQRKRIDEALVQETPVAYMAFDALAWGDAFLVDEPLVQRRERLAEIVRPDDCIFIAPFVRLGEPPDAQAVHDRFEAARAAGHEGLMIKRTDSPYHPGRRGKWWFKLKRELTTLDAVVVAVEWGHGKRAKVLSDYTFAVRGDDGGLLTIGKAYSGLTDAEIAELTPWFLAHQTGAAGNRLLVEPRVVIEVAFDVVQPSDLHQSGFSLRFPRIVRIRDDKPASEIDTVQRVEQIYREMLRREGVER